MKDQIIKDLELLYKDKPNRLKHVYGVRKQALHLGKKHNVNLEKLELASLLHDITKYETVEFHKEKIKQFYTNYYQVFNEFNDKLLHAFSARVIAEQKYGINDEDVLKAIESHTIGNMNMSMIEKIIFISDYTEENRTYESCVKVRKIVEENIDLAVFTAIDDSINFFEKENAKIPATAYRARAYYRKLLEV